MFGELFLKECKQLLKSFMYYLIIIFLLLFYVSQMGEVVLLKNPTPGAIDYGYKYSDDITEVMNAAIIQLIGEYNENLYLTYPIGVYKEVILDEEKKNNVVEIIEELTGTRRERIQSSVSGEKITLKDGITEEEFKGHMKEIDRILGGGSKYNEKNLSHNAVISKTYEDVIKEDMDVINKDKVSRAHARLFCDYMGILLAILPVFLAVARGIEDRRNQVEDAIFCKKISSTRVIASRYLAIVVMVIIPVLLLSILPTLQSIYVAHSNGASADVFAFVKYDIGWLLPTIMFTVAMGFFITEFTGGVLGILVQGVIWFGAMLSADNLVGHVGMNLIPRFNTVGENEVYEKIFTNLVFNRILYVVFAMVLVASTIIMYNLRRKGKLNIYGKVFKHSKSKSEV